MNRQDCLAIVAAINVLESVPPVGEEAAQGLRDLLSTSRARAKPALPWGVMLVEETATRHDVLKFGIIAAVDWEDAERTAELHWSDRTAHQHSLTYDLATFHYWLDKWQVPAALFDKTLPQEAT